MQQRLALAQALMRKPKVLLLDEPFGALDPGIRSDIHVLMKRIWNDANLTVVMVTHDLSEAFALGTRIIAFERPRNRPEERERYGARLTGDIEPSPEDLLAIKGATVTVDIEIWPKKVAGSSAVWTRHGASERPS
jgi:NitT/TauT family transport system ATP-binding protein